jgi:hypothetical protein
MAVLRPEDPVVFKAKIIDQALATSGRGETQLVLTVMLVACLMNPKNPDDGADPCRPQEHEVLISFPEDDEQRLRMAVRDLERLGFEDVNVDRLHPEHADHFTLTGKEVCVRRKVVGGAEYWNLVWPRAVLHGDEVKGATASLAAKIAAAKQKKAGDQKAK